MGAEGLATLLMSKIGIDKGRNIHIAPHWQNKDIFYAISNVVHNSGDYRNIECTNFKFPDNPLKRIDDSASFEELHEQFDSGIISKVYQMAKERDADIAFLIDTRGFGFLNIYAHFYKMT